MKKILILLFATFFSMFLNAQQLADLPQQRVVQTPTSNIINNNMHQIGGFIVAFGTYGIWYGLTENRVVSIILSTATAYIVGHGKETLDKSKGFEYSHNDVWDTTIGGLGGAITFDLFASRHRNRKNK